MDAAQVQQSCGRRNNAQWVRHPRAQTCPFAIPDSQKMTDSAVGDSLLRGLGVGVRGARALRRDGLYYGAGLRFFLKEQ